MKKYLLAIFSLLISSIPSLGIAASEHQGFYISGFLGTSIIKDITFSNNDYQVNNSFSEKLEFDPGIYTGGTGGYDFGLVRLEGELAYRFAEIDSITSKTTNYRVNDVDGNIGVFSSMVNVFIDLHNSSRITPYLGGGIGFATLYISDTDGYVTDGNNTYYETVYWESDDTVFAYQLGGGAAIALNDRFSIDVGYRYFKTDKAHFDSYYSSTSSESFESNDVMVGLRVKF